MSFDEAGRDVGGSSVCRAACGGAGGAARRRPQAFDGSDHGLDVRRRGAAAAADQRRAELGVAAGVTGEVGGVGGVLEAPVDEARRAGVGLRGQRQEV